MSKIYAKLLVWLVLTALMAVIGSGVLSGTANLIAYFQRGADPAAALNIVPNVPPDQNVECTWRADPPDPGRALDRLTRSQIVAGYLRGWLQLNFSYARGEPYGLKTYFVGPALQAAQETIRAARTDGFHGSQVDTRHELELHFYSADGSIVSFTDHDALVTYLLYDDAGQVITTGDVRATYDVVMFLEDGNWRVRNWARRSAEDLSSLGSVPSSPPKSGFVTREGRRLTLDGQEFLVAGVDYYPRTSPWDRFWSNYDAAEIEWDFTVLAGLGANSVRVFVPFDQFGGPSPKPVMLDRLAALLDRANHHHLKVIVTLFDFFEDYTMLRWPAADRHVEALARRFRDHPAVLAWDVKDDPSRGYAAFGREVVDTWLVHTAGRIRAFDPNHLITISWMNSESAANLTDAVDFVSFHFSGPSADLKARYSALRAAEPVKPIVITAFGMTTWNSFFFPGGHSEAEQACYYAEVLAAVRASDCSGYLAWTLLDYGYVPPQVVGRAPWRRNPQHWMGIVRADGSLKPAARFIRPGAKLDAPHSVLDGILKPFRLTLLLCAALLAIVASRRSGRWRAFWRS
jgi:uncharacterized protein YndB with AHSA1/START domain